MKKFRKIKFKKIKVMLGSRRLFFVIILTFFYTSFTYANVDSDLNSFFNGLGFSSNTTAPNAYQVRKPDTTAAAVYLPETVCAMCRLRKSIYPVFALAAVALIYSPADFPLSIRSNWWT